MTSILTDLASELAKKLVDLVLGEARYICCFKCIVEDFEKEKKKLIDRKKGVEEDVAQARNRAENVRYEVHTWLNEAEKYIKEEREKGLLEKEEQTKKVTCFHEWCPKCIDLYRRGKELDDMKLDILGLRKQNLEKVGLASKLPGVEFYALENFIALDSRTSAYKNVLETLKDGNNYIVGLHGLGGMGKTTLATKVGMELKGLKVFDEVIFAIVSNDPNIKNIQDDIAGPLGLSLKDESESDRRKKLWLRLTSGDKVLIILDDLWRKLDYNEIGIPPSGENHHCRVLLTSRDAEVCNLMGCAKPITLEPISDKDAQILFESLSGISNKFNKDLSDKGKEIAKYCKGLPVAIATIASTLKNRPLDVWNSALTALKSADDADDNLITIYEKLKVSYDYLNNDEAKKLFILCSVFPEDCEILVEDLFRFGVGLGLFGEVHSYKARRSRVDKARRELIDSCLLLEGKRKGYVRMHDLVRDAAHWIAYKENQFGVLHMVPGRNANEKKDTNAIRYLFCRGIFVNDQLDWTKLEVVILADIDEGFVKVQEAFFERMKILRVLSLHSKWYYGVRLDLRLPRSIGLLKSLQTLRLRNFNLTQSNVVEDLPSLEIFDLRNCSMHELPIEIAKLTKLRLLSMVDCQLELNPYKVIGQFSTLEELYFKKIQRSYSSETWELNKEVAIKSSLSRTLQRYHIDIRDGSVFNNWRFHHSIPRASQIKYFDPDASNAPIMNLVRRSECLSFLEIQGGYKAIIPYVIDAIGGDMNELTSFMLYSCSKIEYLIHATNNRSLEMAKAVFSKLVELYLFDMDTLKTLCYSFIPRELSFERLKRVHVERCHALTSLFMLSAARSLVALEELRVEECKELKYIVEDEQSREEEIIEDGSDKMFPKLKTVNISQCDRLEFIFPVFCVGDLPLLETIEMSSCGELKYIFGQCQLDGRVLHPNGKEIILPSLEGMKLIGVPKFVNIFPECCQLNPSSSFAQSSAPKNGFAGDQKGPHKRYTFCWASMCFCASAKKPKLRKSATNTGSLIVSKALETTNYVCVRSSDTSQCILGQSLMLRNIKKLRLENCGEITSLFRLSIAAKMLLEELRIDTCHGMKHVITYVGNDHDRTVYPMLKYLSVSNCTGLESIFSENYDKDENLSIEIDIELPALEEVQLTNLERIINICPRSFNLTCSSLKKFSVKNCPQFTIPTFSDSSVVSFDTTQMDCETTETSNSKCLPPINIAQCLLRQSLMLQTVKIMTLGHCGKIESLFTLSIASTMLLEELKIKNCHELRYLITDMGNNHDHMSIFQKLKKVSVWNCSKLIYMVGRCYDEGPNHNTGIHIGLPALEDLDLGNLPSMVSIFPRNYHATLPPLKRLSMDDCPKFAIKSVTDFTMIHSDATQLDDTATKDLLVKQLQTLEILCLENFEIQDIFDVEGLTIKEGEKMSLGPRVMELTDMPELKYIWRGPKNCLTLQNLNELQIVRCDELEVIFSATILRRIPVLKVLTITNCKILEEIVEEKEENGVWPEVWFPELRTLGLTNIPQLKCIWRDPKNCLTLQNLNELRIEGSDKFEVIFSAAILRRIPVLKVLTIRNSQKLEKIVEENEENGAWAEVWFPELIILAITDCSSLKNVAPTSAANQFPKLKCVILVKLPTLRNVGGGIELERVECQFVHDCNPIINHTSSTAALQRFKDECLNYKDPLQLGFELRWTLKDLFESVIRSVEEDGRVQETSIENLNSEMTNAPSQMGTANTNGEITEGAAEIEGSSSQKDESLISEATSRDQKHPQNTIKSTEKMEEQSIGQCSKLEEVVEALVDEPISAKEQQTLAKTKNTLKILETNNSIEEMEGGRNSQECPKLEKLLIDNQSKKADHVEQKDGKMISEPSSKDQQQQHAEIENTIKIPQETNSIEKKKEQSLKERSKSEEAMATSTLPKVDSKQSSSSINPMHKVPAQEEELVDEPSAKDQQQALGKTKNSLKILESTEEIKGQKFQERPKSKELVIEHQSKKTNHVKTSETQKAHLDPSVATVNKASQTETHIGMDSLFNAVNHQNVEDKNLNQLMVKDAVTEEASTAKDNLVAKVLLDLEVYLKMHLKDIASSKSNCIRLQTSLNFLSGLSIENGLLSDELKSIIDSLQQEFPSILCSFKKAFAIVRKFAELEDGEKSLKEEISKQTEADFTLASKISQINKLKDEAQRKEASFKNHISRLQIELECVKKDKSQMTEKQKAQQKLLEMDYEWSFLCCQFQNNPRPCMASTSTHLDSGSSSVAHLQEASPQDVEDVHISSSLQTMKEDDCEVSMPAVSTMATRNPVIESNLVSKAFSDLQVILMKPLKDIATSADNSLRLHTALNFLSRRSFEDGALSNDLKAIINSLQQDLPSILCSFKEAFAVSKKFAELEEREASIQEHMFWLHVQTESVKEKIKEFDGNLSYLQDQKNDCMADIKGLKMKFESLGIDKCEMIEDQRKAQQELFQLDYKWSALCSLFKMNSIAARNSF